MEAKRIGGLYDDSKRHQAGNSIVKNVLMAIFGQMIEGKEEIYKDI